MKDTSIHPENESLKYEIRKIVSIAKQIESMGKEITWENIGDPIAKGELVPAWVKAHVKAAAEQDTSYAYSPTCGVESTREFIASRHNQHSSANLRAENIIFFNGLGDAISHIYRNLAVDVRVIGPDPAYPTHVIGETAHANDSALTYRLDPEAGWQIDLVDLESKLQAHPNVRGILLINPGNPTGVVLSKKTLEGVVSLAQKHNCFLVVDAIYDQLRFGDASDVRVTDLMKEVPSVVMRGLSKVVPWPGARCGWLEFYNTQHKFWADFRDQLVQTKMREVCSTTLPQVALPEIFSDERWSEYLAKRNLHYETRAQLLVDAFAGISEVTVTKPTGAYYASVVFAPGVLNNYQALPIDNQEVAELVKKITTHVNPDKRFVYYLLGAEGVCTVPLSSGFFSQYNGFRLTLLEQDMNTFKQMLQNISGAVKEYLKS